MPRAGFTMPKIGPARSMKGKTSVRMPKVKQPKMPKVKKPRIKPAVPPMPFHLGGQSTP